MFARKPHRSHFIAAMLIMAVMLSGLPPAALAADPAAGTLNAPSGSGTASVSWTGGPYTVVTPDPVACVSSAVNCDEFTLTINAPGNYWATHEGDVTIEISWASSADDFDLYVYDSAGQLVGQHHS